MSVSSSFFLFSSLQITYKEKKNTVVCEDADGGLVSGKGQTQKCEYYSEMGEMIGSSIALVRCWGSVRFIDIDAKGICTTVTTRH